MAVFSILAIFLPMAEKDMKGAGTGSGMGMSGAETDGVYEPGCCCEASGQA